MREEVVENRALELPTIKLSAIWKSFLGIENQHATIGAPLDSRSLKD